jgi:hypothetical protein
MSDFLQRNPGWQSIMRNARTHRAAERLELLGFAEIVRHPAPSTWQARYSYGKKKNPKARRPAEKGEAFSNPVGPRMDSEELAGQYHNGNISFVRKQIQKYPEWFGSVYSMLKNQFGYDGKQLERFVKLIKKPGQVFYKTREWGNPKAKRMEKGHVLLPDGKIYCAWQGVQAPPVITHSGIKCKFCGEIVQSMHGKRRSNPTPPLPGMVVNEKGDALFHYRSMPQLVEWLYRQEVRDWATVGGLGWSFVPWKSRAVPSKNPCKGPTKIYGRTEKIFMTKTSGPYKGQKFVHAFRPGVEQIGFPRGTVVTFPGGTSKKLTTRSVLMTGKKDIWGNFPA